jgi:uncharacterized protein (DUF58 family)
MQHDAAGLLIFDEHVGDYVPPRFRPGHLRRLMVSLERTTGGRRTGIALPLEQIARVARRRGMVVLVSDFLAPLDGLQKNLGYLRARGHEVLVLRVLDPQEVQFDFSDASIFEDMETGREKFVDPETIRRNYQRQFAAHAERLEEICRSQSAQLTTLTTDQPLDLALAGFVRRRRRIAGRARRRSPRQAAGKGGGG